MVEEISDAPEPESPPLILPVVVEDSSVAPVEELIELGPSALGSSLPPPPGFSPFSWPVSDGGIDVDELCARIGVDCSPSVSPIRRMCIDVSDLTVSPGVGVLVSLIIDGSSDVAPAVGHAELTLPPVDNCFVKDMLWAPAASQDKRPNDDREIPVAVGSGGSIPHGALAGVHPFHGGRVRIQTHDVSRLGLCCASGGLCPNPAPPVVHRMDRGSPVGWTSRNLWCPVGRQTLTGPGRCGGRAFTTRCGADADERGCPGSIGAIAPEDGVQEDRSLSGRRCGDGCPRPSGPPRRGTDGSNGAVASIVGSAAAPLE